MISIYAYQSPSGKIYIGQTIKSLDHRSDNGKGYQRCVSFYAAIKKYGIDNFDRWIIKIVDNLEEANQEEIFWINEMRNQLGKEKIYNLTDGGSTGKHSEETKKKMSISQKGRIITLEARRKLSIAHTGKQISEKTKKKISEYQKNRSKTIEQRQKMSEAAKHRYAKNG